MTGFENWLDKKSYSQAKERVAEVTWKAALGWVLKDLEYWDKPISDRIKEELNATT